MHHGHRRRSADPASRLIVASTSCSESADEVDRPARLREDAIRGAPEPRTLPTVNGSVARCRRCVDDLIDGHARERARRCRRRTAW